MADIKKVLKHTEDGKPKTDQAFAKECEEARKGGFQLFEENSIFHAFVKR